MRAPSFTAKTALFLALSVVATSVAPMLNQRAIAQSTFSDVRSGYWANDFIQALVQRGVIAGFPDGTFRPEERVTRAQFAAMLRKAFNKSSVRSSVQFSDVSSTYWGAAAIQNAYTSGFMAGYPGNEFKPEQSIPRAQVLVSLANGLNYSSSESVDRVLSIYEDGSEVPGYARPSIAAATEKQIVVNYPRVERLNPNQTATRAEVAAFIYQALVSTNQAASITSPYIVGQAAPIPQAIRIPAGTAIPLKYDQAQKILLAPNEPNPSPLTLKVAQNIVTANGQVVIPAGSNVSGQLQTMNGKAQFIANEIILPSGDALAFSANSDMITTKETVKKGTTTGKILAGTVVGAGAATAIAGVTGDKTIKAEEVLGGAVAGALASVVFGGEKVELIAINPNTDLNVTLNSDLVIR